MEWISIKQQKPTEIKKYLCFVPESEEYEEHWAEYLFNGVYFIGGKLGDSRIIEPSHYFEIVKPDNNES